MSCLADRGRRAIGLATEPKSAPGLEVRATLTRPWYRLAVAEKDPYELLGVPRNASDERIRAAYELEINRATRDGAIRYAAELSAAYDTISSPQRRALYERHGLTAIGQRSPATVPPPGAWQDGQQPRRRTRRRRLKVSVLLIFAAGVAVGLVVAAQRADGAPATEPAITAPAIVQLTPDR